MTDKTKWAGWIIACILFAILMIQRSCAKKGASKISLIHDTITIKGDRELITVQDTVLQPAKIIYKPIRRNLVMDTPAVLKDYFALRTYTDTVRGREVLAVIKDSVADNKLVGRKVFIENTRDKQVTDTKGKPVAKLFVGGFFGLSQQNFLPVAGFSLCLVTKNDAMYHYGFDVISGTHTVGMSWKLSLRKK